MAILTAARQQMIFFFGGGGGKSLEVDDNGGWDGRAQAYRFFSAFKKKTFKRQKKRERGTYPTTY